MKFLRRSLTLKWVLTLLLSSLSGIVIVGLLASQTTFAAYDQLRTEQTRASLLAQLTAYYQAHGSWTGLDSFMQQNNPASDQNQPRSEPPQLFELADASGAIVYGGDPAHYGQMASAAQLAQGDAITVNGQKVGTLLSGNPPPGLDPREQQYFQRTNIALVLGALGASLAALLVGLLLSRQFLRPLTELREAITGMRRGDLNQRVQVRTNDELGELAETFNQMSAQIHRADQLRQQMTADVAHDLRTPLMVINGYLEALCDGTLQPTQARFETMRQEALHLQRLIEDLRTLSLADAGELKLILQPVKANDLLRQVQQSFEPLAQQQKVSLNVTPAENGDLPSIHVDQSRMAQVLGNLVTNALRYTPEGGSVTLSARREGDYVQIAVQDTGSGIDPEKLPNIFERFYRTEGSRHQDGDESGLGLAIARSIVESHGGTIGATSIPGRGTAITINLPIASPLSHQ